MALANQYGIDLGNILSTESAIKTSRLNQRAKQLELDKAQAGNILRTNVLNKQENKKREAEFKAGQASGLEGPMEKPLDTLNAEDENKLMAIAPEATIELQKSQAMAQQQEALKRMYISQGESEEVAAFKSNMDVEDVVKFEKMYAEKDEKTQEAIRNAVAQQGRMIEGILTTAKDNPQQAEQMFQDYKTSQLEKINQLRKSGNNVEADQIESGLKRVPKSLITPEGGFNAGYLTLTLGKLDSALTTAESYQKEKESAMKQRNELFSEDYKQENRLQLERVRAANKSTTGTPKEFQQLMTAMDREQDPAKKKLIQARLDKLTQGDMSSLLINTNTVKEAQNSFAQTIGLDDPYKLATIDVRKLSPEKQAEADQLSSIIVKGLGANAKEADKKMAEFGALAEQSQNALTAYENVGNFRLLDETTKKYWSNYMGLSEKELESSEAAAAFQSMLNIKIKADSGSAVSGQEMVRNTLETASTSMDKRKIVLGIKNIAKRQIGALKGLKNVMGPVAFNLKYGSVLSNYEDIVKATNEVDTKPSTKADKAEELRRKYSQPQQPTREQAAAKIKAQYPNATDEQIEKFLQSKGL